MSFLGGLLVLLGAFLVVRTTRAVFSAPSPYQLIAALLLPAACALVVLGAVLLAVPGFFGS